MPRLTTRLLGLSAALVIGGLGVALLHVIALERGELEYESGWHTLASLAHAPGSTDVSARLGRVFLREGERSLFELCSRDRLEGSRWASALELAVFRLPSYELMLRVPLDAAHLDAARRNPHGACLVLGGGRIERSGEYSIDAVWSSRPLPVELRTVPLNLRVLARAASIARERWLVASIGLGALLAVCALWFAHRKPAPADTGPEAPRTRKRLAAMLGACVGLAALLVGMEIPSDGASMTLLKGIGLVLLQSLLAFALARVFSARDLVGALGLRPPPRVLRWAFVAVLSAAALFVSARLALHIVPSTGEAPIQSFISWPSGMLCFAALGCILPLGEELFFRGFLYDAALVFGPRAAFLVSTLAFIGLHAQQSWGQWGALVSIAAVGLLLTALRASSGSLLVPAIAHLLYNFALSMASF